MNSKHNGIRTAIIVVTMLIPVLLGAQERPDALAMYRQGEYEKAISVCLNELEASPRNMNSYTVLGWSLIALKTLQDALDYGMQGLGISRYDHRVVEIVGEANFYLEITLIPSNILRSIPCSRPPGIESEWCTTLWGRSFIRIGEYNHADIAFSTAVYHRPNIARWWARLGYSREMAEDFAYAMNAYDQALKLNPSLSDALRGKERAAVKMEGA